VVYFSGNRGRRALSRVALITRVFFNREYTGNFGVGRRMAQAQVLGVCFTQ
jgi:hypothetical protein